MVFPELSAAYLVDLLQYCAEGKSGRFGVIEFAVEAPVSEEFKKAVSEVPEADWQTLYRSANAERVDTGQQYAEVCFVPKWVWHKKHGPTCRYVAIREPLEEPALPCMEDQVSLPFPTMDWGSERYKVTGIVKNREIAGDELIW